MHFQIIVKNQGEPIATHIIDAASALAAIKQVEPLYGEPVRVEFVTVELEDGRKRHEMKVHNWHGYSFLARKVLDNDPR